MPQPPSPDRTASLSRLPSVDALLRDPVLGPAIVRHGRTATTAVVRTVLSEIRTAASPMADAMDAGRIAVEVAERLDRQAAPSLRAVFNLTGTVLHTNPGRAPLPQEAVAAVIRSEESRAGERG